MTDKEKRVVLLEVLRKLSFAQGFLEISDHTDAASGYNDIINDVMQWLTELYSTDNIAEKNQKV